MNYQRRSNKGFGYGFSYSMAGVDYNPGMGFEMRENYTRLCSGLWYGWFPAEKSLIFRHQAFISGLLFLRNTDGSTESAAIGPTYKFETKSGYGCSISPKFFYENVTESFEFSDEAEMPAGQYTFYGLNGTFTTPDQKLFCTEVTIYGGTFYDGRRTSIGVSPKWCISSTWELKGTYQLNRIVFPDRNQEFSGQIARLRTLLMLNTRLSAIAFIQYNSAIDALTVNIRLRYNPREGNDLYLVYNEGINANRYREKPILPFTSNRALMLKYTYTFNF